jgi:hypothetical protein
MAAGDWPQGEKQRGDYICYVIESENVANQRIFRLLAQR